MFSKLNEKVAYIKNNPIYNPIDMTKTIETDTIDNDWNNNIKSLWWYHSNRTPPKLPAKFNFDDKIFDLREKLLSFAGYEVCLPLIEEDLDKILERGQLWYGDNVCFMKGQPSQCHRNSSYCWYNNKKTTALCTGYALSKDGMWRQHSWVVHIKSNENVIVETTEPRVAYFGFAMSPREANDFYFENE